MEPAPPSPEPQPAPPPPKKRRRPFVLIFKTIAWLLATVVLLLLAVFVFLQTTPGRELVKDLVVDVLNDALRGRIEVDRIGGLLPFSAEIEGFRVFDPEGRQVLSVARVTADFHPLDLLDRTVRLSDVLVERPEVLLFDEKDRLALLEAFSPRVVTPDTNDPMWLLSFEGIRLDAGTVERIMPGPDSLSLADLALDLTLGLGPDGLKWPHLALRGRLVGPSALADLVAGGEGDLVLTTRGGFEGARVNVSALELSIGGHSILAHGFIDPSTTPNLASALTLTHVRLQLDRLPEPLRSQLTIEGETTPGAFSGAGHLALSAAGLATIELTATSPLALLRLWASADLRLGQPELLGDWATRIRLTDLALPADVAARLPQETRDARLALLINADGTHLPPGVPGDKGRLHLEVDLIERHAGAPPGRLRLVVDRQTDRDTPAATAYTARLSVDEIGLQPWLQLAQEPDLAGAIDHLYLEGEVVLPPGEAPIVEALLASDVSVQGQLHAITPSRPLLADRLSVSGALSWQGLGLPSVRLDLRGANLSLAPASADSLRVSLDLVDHERRGPHLQGSVLATRVRYEDLSIGRLELPLSLALGPTLDTGALPTGRVRWSASDIVHGSGQGQRRLAATTGDLDIAREGRNHRVRGRVTHDNGIFDRQLSVGGSQLDLDLVLAPSAGSPVGGPITGRVDGTVTRIASGPYRVAALSLVDLQVALPLGPRGLDGTLVATGKLLGAGVEAPEGSAGRFNVDLDTRLDPKTMEASGRARIEASDVVVKAGEGGPIGKNQRLAKLVLDAEAKGGGTIAFTGTATQPRPKADPKGEKPPASLEARFRGELTLPSSDRALAARLEGLDLFRQGDLEPTLSLGPTRFVDGGWIELDSLALRNQRRMGAITASGRFHPRTLELELDLEMNDLQLARWSTFAREIQHWLDLDSPPPAPWPHDPEGRLSLAVKARGSLNALRFDLRLRMGDLQYGKSGGAHLDVLATLDADGLDFDVSTRWRNRTSLNAHGRAAARLSLSPLSLTWDEAAPLALEVRANERDLSDALTAVAEVLPAVKPPKNIDGSLDLVLKVDGTAADPRLATALVLDGLDLTSKWRDGRLALEGSAREDRSVFTLALTDKDGLTQSRIDLMLPFSIPAAVRERDPIAWAKARLDHREFSITALAPPFVIGKSPLAELLPLDFAELSGELDLRFGGTLIEPTLKGKVSLNAPETLPMAFDFGLALATTVDGGLTANLGITQPGGISLVDGSLKIPDLSKLLRSPDSLSALLRDPQSTFELKTGEIRSLDLWELRQSLGQTFAQLFPDGWLMVDVSAHGSPDGPVARTYVRIRTSPPIGLSGSAAADPNAPRRNAADDVRLSLTLGQEVALNAVITQDTRSLTPSLGVSLALGLSMDQLLSGPMPALDQLPITRGRIVAGELRLEGFAAVLKSTLGTSSGTLTGDLGITGTVLAPRFEGGLNAQFDRLVVAPIGLDQDNVTVSVSFQEGTRWALDTSPLYAESLTARSTTDYCGVAPRVIGALDLTKKPYLSVALNGEIPKLDPKTMTLAGCIGMKDYPVLDTRSLAARIDGSLTLDGTVAQPALRGELKVVDALLAPELASKSIRPIGLPLDVTLVRGDPVPPPERPAKNPFKTGVLLDIAVTLPKDVVRVEPSLMQPYGEVRALLYPQGELRIRTVDGELSLVGTIEVPKETVFLYGKTFTVDPDSRLVFTGDMANDPQLFFTARYNIADLDLSSIGLTTTRDSEVVVRVTGTPTEPRLEFTSSPSMDETNILSVIALGVPAGGGEALGDAVQSQLLTAVMGMATLQFARDFQQRLALDVLRIEARSADPTDTRLTVGKRLSEDLLLSYYLNLSAREGEDRQSGSLEYRLTRYLSLLARAGDAGDVGLELNFRFADKPPAPRTSPRRRERPDNRPRKDPETLPAPR